MKMNKYRLINYHLEENAKRAMVAANRLSATVFYRVLPRFDATYREKTNGKFILIIESEDEICGSDLNNIRSNIIEETFEANNLTI